MNWLLSLVVCLAGTTQDNYTVDMEVIISAGASIENNQRWIEMLSEVGAADVRMRSGTAQRPSIEKLETSFGTTYKITAVLNTRNQLLLPGGTFSIRDKEKIRQLITSIRDDGAEVALAEKMAFGLTAEQLVELHTDLSVVYEESTIGRRPKEILDDIRGLITTPINVNQNAISGLRDDYVMEDELKGMTAGTVMAACMRPVGLVAAPHRPQGKATEIVIADSQSVEEHWPVGWPLQVRPSQAIPKIHERIPVNIQNFTMQAALAAISERLEAPFLYDYNSLAREGLDLEEVRVNMQSEESSYNYILQRLLSQSRPRMQMEFRADEAGNAFIWISPRNAGR